MQKVTVLAFGLGLALAGAASLTDAQAACSVRGNWCGYPYWAANAFEAPRNRVSEGVFAHDRQDRYERPAPRRRYSHEQDREYDRRRK